ncbi:hypothetical protein VIGAN_04169000 [Vigna angularis var. angularis]|uniref:CCHC-type domain-containing protein n=1 Tax=Vigna angularis var. angularis TaxID=157739 RepID=A0A0S3RUW9_PHAAN|nr:hypothetical protein VIGAN_04169000 [Vigna angularis var. angularis]
MSMPILFGKLREHELELRRLTAEEDQGKRKTLAFKSEISKGKSSKRIEEDDSDDEENMSLMIKKFAKFMKAKGKDKFHKDRKESQESPSNVKCFGCGERGHVKSECPKSKKSEDKKERKFQRKKKAYIAWEDNASSSTSSSDTEEEANICLMAKSEDTRSQVSDSSFESSELDLQKAFCELLIESEKLDVAHKKHKKEHNELKLNYEKLLDDEVVLRNKVSSLETKLSDANVTVEPVECLSCKNHMFDIDILENLLAKETKTNSHAKTNLKRSNVENRNMHQINKSKERRTRRVWVEKGTFVKNKVSNACCFYCMKHGHTSNKCNIKHVGVPSGKYAWVKAVR